MAYFKRLYAENVNFMLNYALKVSVKRFRKNKCHLKKKVLKFLLFFCLQTNHVCHVSYVTDRDAGVHLHLQPWPHLAGFCHSWIFWVGIPSWGQEKVHFLIFFFSYCG